jgi:hypothetical protein
MIRVLLAIALLPALSGEIVSSNANNLSFHLLTSEETSEEVSFKSFGKAAPALSQPSVPIVYIAASENDLLPFITLLSDEHQDKIKNHDFSGQVIVAVFAGSKGSTGYEIEVKRINRTKDGLRIVVKQTSPKPDDYGLEVLTSPYHLVAIQSSDMECAKGVAWILEDTRGARLAAGRT